MSNRSKIKMSSNRSFGLVFFVVFSIIAFWSFRGNIEEIKILPLCIAAVFFILGLINSNILTPINKLWFKFGILLGNIISPIVMAIIFFLIVTPTGIFMKILRRDILRAKYNKKMDSYWIKKEKSPSTMKQQF